MLMTCFRELRRCPQPEASLYSCGILSCCASLSRYYMEPWGYDRVDENPRAKCFKVLRKVLADYKDKDVYKIVILGTWAPGDRL